MRKRLEAILWVATHSQEEHFMKAHISAQIPKGYKIREVEDNLLVEPIDYQGKLPLIISHMDTVHEIPEGKSQIRLCRFTDTDEYTSEDGVGGDDKCGIFIALELMRLGVKAKFLFTHSEEIGGIGIHDFCHSPLSDEWLADVQYAIECDRKGNTDWVVEQSRGQTICTEAIKHYTEYMKEQGFKVDRTGSYTDCFTLSEEKQIQSFNISSGYHNAHTKKETVSTPEVLHTLETIIGFIAQEPPECFTKKFEVVDHWMDYDTGAYSSLNEWGRYGVDPNLKNILTSAIEEAVIKGFGIDDIVEAAYELTDEIEEVLAIQGCEI